MNIRKCYKKQIRVHMFILWLAGLVVVLGSFFYTHDTLHHDDYTTIVLIMSGTAILMWHYCSEVINFSEISQAKNRKTTH